MSTLTDEQRQLIRHAGGEPLRLLDPETNQQYVLLPAEDFDRFKGVLNELEPRELYPALERALGDEGWNDPHMDDYNRYA
jgi:hypothetical protein